MTTFVYIRFMALIMVIIRGGTEMEASLAWDVAVAIGEEAEETPVEDERVILSNQFLLGDLAVGGKLHRL